MCGLCHTEIDRALIYRDDRYLAGGMRVGAYPQGVFISRNLTSDPNTGLGRWSDAEVASAIRDGRSKDGRELNLWGMPWAFFHNLTPDDAQAIARYLKTLPASHNEIPPPLHYGVVETIAAKFWLGDPLLGQAPRLTYDIGSYANPDGLTAGAIEAGLAWTQGAVLVAAIILFVVAPRPPRTRRRWARAIGGAIASVRDPFGRLLLRRDAGPADPAARGDFERGEWDHSAPRCLAGVARARRPRCAWAVYLCQRLLRLVPRKRRRRRTKGERRRLRNSVRGESHLGPRHGTRRWSDAEIARAIRSGVSRDGRPLFWQGMPWDHFSNLDEEDVASVIAFLRMLPPVARKTPAYRPPGPDDCPIYTFWTVPQQAPGCR